MAVAVMVSWQEIKISLSELWTVTCNYEKKVLVAESWPLLEHYIRYNGPKLWNETDERFKILTPHLFKKELTKHFIKFY